MVSEREIPGCYDAGFEGGSRGYEPRNADSP